MNNLGLSIAMHKHDLESDLSSEMGFDHFNIEKHCKKIIDLIEILREHIIKINGLDELDKLSNIIHESYDI